MPLPPLRPSRPPPSRFSQLKTKKKRKEKFVIIGKKNYENIKRNLNNVGPTSEPASKAKHGQNLSEKRNWNVRGGKKKNTKKLDKPFRVWQQFGLFGNLRHVTFEKTKQNKTNFNLE